MRLLLLPCTKSNKGIRVRRETYDFNYPLIDANMDDMFLTTYLMLTLYDKKIESIHHGACLYTPWYRNTSRGGRETENYLVCTVRS